MHTKAQTANGTNVAQYAPRADSSIVSDSTDGDNQDSRKRRRVDDGVEIALNQSDGSVDVRKLPRKEPRVSVPLAANATAPSNANGRPQPAKAFPKPLESAKRDVSPPPLRNRPGKSLSTTNPELTTNTSRKPTKSKKEPVKEDLNPRLLSRPPASHAIRFVILSKLHEQLIRLNDELIKKQDPSTRSLELSPQELITLALDEEERAANENPSVYSNVVKLRIVKFKNMKLEAWKKFRAESIALEAISDELPHIGTPPPINTGLTVLEELSVLPKLIAQQEGLQKFGYVVAPPNDAEIDASKKGVEASQGWEQCDRCRTRFQVFAGRREEDGALTSGGRCTYHPGKQVRPVKSKTDAIKGHVESTYSCCSETVGSSSGCTTVDTHVYKVSSAKRLAAVMQFKETPENPKVSPEQAVCFDCEMGYTVFGMELVRLTATAWPSGKELIDVLVRPKGEVLDLNSGFSGVFPEHLTEAIPYSTSAANSTSQKEDGGSEPKADRPTLMIMESPAAARDLLFSFLSPNTPLIGHAIENDMIASRIVHPNIIDTVLLYPHPRGLPIRYGLKMLTSKYLGRNIQTGGATGHDSKEDARAAGDLVRLKVAETWALLKRDGWAFREGVLSPPLPRDSPRGQTKVLGPGGARPQRF
ncbi:MAG: RNA exonuclease 3 [Candelina mexicana]|nr:MAG: RNA exonuclease 3 [Candelina mexicana]